MIKNNARVGGEIAVELSKLRRAAVASRTSSRRVQKHSNRKQQVVVIGASILDFTAKIKTTHILVGNLFFIEL